MREWYRSLAVAPEPLAPTEKRALLIATLLAAITRWLAVSRTLWDWDEALFVLGMRDFDVSNHRPHPPGFPLFIGTAKLFSFLGLSDFRALQMVTVLASLAVVPAMFFMARELRAGFRTALIAAIFLALFPNVWYFGGTAFSDVPSMVLSMLAVGLLLRGCRSNGAFLLGAVVTGIAAGYRPQNLVIVAVPALLAVSYRWRTAIVALLIVVVIAGAAFTAAAYLTGWDEYAAAVAAHQAYIRKTDSFTNPDRPALWRLFDDFFVRPYRFPVVNAIVTLLVLLGLSRRRAPALAVAASFGPFCLMAWLFLDHFSASRFSIAWMPMFALLAAEGARFGRKLETAIATVAAAVMIAFMWSPLRIVHTTISPPQAAANWIRANVDRGTTLYVHDGMIAFAQALLPGYRQQYIYLNEQPPAGWSERDQAMFLREGASAAGSAHNFIRERGRLARLTRERYFEVSVRQAADMITFGDGWYMEEGTDQVWRWMGRRSVSHLPPMKTRATLSMRIYLPLDAIPPPTITITLNGVAIDRFVATTMNLEKTYDITPRADRPNELVIETNHVVQPPGGDPRVLGVRLDGIDWKAAASGVGGQRPNS